MSINLSSMSIFLPLIILHNYLSIKVLLGLRGGGVREGGWCAGGGGEGVFDLLSVGMVFVPVHIFTH